MSEPGFNDFFTIYQIFSFLPVSKTASGESGQNNGGLVRGKGIGTFAEVMACVSEAGQKILPTAVGMVLADLRGKGLVRQRSLFADLIFCYFLIKQYGEALLSTLKNKQQRKT